MKYRVLFSYSAIKHVVCFTRRRENVVEVSGNILTKRGLRGKLPLIGID